MADLMATNADIEYPKIKTHFAVITADGDSEKPYYSILYFDPTDGEYHLGYSSSNIRYVRAWLEEEFEIADGVACDGCIYANRKRPQKCSCCRRNRDLKDCYERREENAAD